MSSILVSKHHPYTVVCDLSSNSEQRRTLNLFLKYERIFASLPDGQINDFYNIVEAKNLKNKIINLIAYDVDMDLINKLNVEVLKKHVIKSTDYSSCSKKAAFCIFGWEQVYNEAV